jgi:hypothetical protein
MGMGGIHPMGELMESPLNYTSPNAPSKNDILGTILLPVLAGHTRYAHIAAIRFDSVNPGLLGMAKVVSEDSARRAFRGADEQSCQEWLQSHLRRGWEALLHEPWILEVDGTVKPLYGNQEGAVVGYNPHKPGRPSHVYQTYVIANLRLVLDVEVQPGNQTAASFAQPRLWSILDNLPKEAWPQLRQRKRDARSGEPGLTVFVQTPTYEKCEGVGGRDV